MNKEEKAAKTAKKIYFRIYLKRLLSVTEFEDNVDSKLLQLEHDQIVQALDYAKEWANGNYEL